MFLLRVVGKALPVPESQVATYFLPLEILQGPVCLQHHKHGTPLRSCLEVSRLWNQPWPEEGEEALALFTPDNPNSCSAVSGAVGWFHIHISNPPFGDSGWLIWFRSTVGWIKPRLKPGQRLSQTSVRIDPWNRAAGLSYKKSYKLPAFVHYLNSWLCQDLAGHNKEGVFFN